jgi:hypothetical protein
MGREIESRQGIRWQIFRKNYILNNFLNVDFRAFGVCPVPEPGGDEAAEARRSDGQL